MYFQKLPVFYSFYPSIFPHILSSEFSAAYYHAPAREISVYDYSQIIFSAIIGFALFHQIPDRYSVLGYVIIIGMAVWMFFYNQRRDASDVK